MKLPKDFNFIRAFKTIWPLTSIFLVTVIVLAVAVVTWHYYGEKTGKPVVQKTEKSTTYKNPDGSYTTKISATPTRYEDSSGKLADIDTKIVRSTTAGYDWEMTKAPYNMYFKNNPAAKEAIKMSYQGSYLSYQLKGFRWISSTDGDLISFSSNTPTVNKNVISWNGGKLPKLQTTLHDAFSKEEWIVASKDQLPTLKSGEDLSKLSLAIDYVVKPSSGLKFQIDEKDWDGKEINVTNQNSLRLVKSDGTLFTLFPTPVIKDKNPLDIANGSYKLFTSGGEIVLRLYTPGSFLAKASYPVVIDPSFTGTSGSIIQVVSQLASAGYPPENNSPIWYFLPIPMYSGIAGQLYSLASAGSQGWRKWRSYVEFDTSSIPDGANITAASLYFETYYGSGDLPSTFVGRSFNFQVRNYDWGSSVNSSDWVNPGSYGLSGSKLLPASSGGTTLNSFTISFNTTGTGYINKTGTTRYMLTSDKDENNSNPDSTGYFCATGSGTCEWYGFSPGTISLSVTYTSPTKYNCTSNSCVANSNGTYGSLAECQANCGSPPPPTKYRCGSGYSCVADPSGSYESLADCQYACSAPVIQYPDYVVNNLNVSGTLEVGNVLSFSGYVMNQGTIYASVTSHTRLRLDVGNNGSWNVTPPYKVTSALGIGRSEVAAWPALWVATAGTHKFEICADVLNTFPPNQYFFYGEVGESNEKNNCENMVFTVVQPDFSVLVSPEPPKFGIVEQGDLATYKITVTSLANFSGTVNLTQTLAGPGITISPSSLGSVTLSPGVPVVLYLSADTSSPDDPTPTPSASYPFTVTGTSGTLTHSAPATLQVIAPIPKPWIKTEGGDVGAAGGGISMTKPPPGANVNADYLVIAAGAINNFKSAKDWLVGTSLNPYTVATTDTEIIPSYSYLRDKYKPQSWSSANTLPSSGVYEYTGGDFVIEAGTTVAGSKPTVFFVSGSLHLNRKNMDQNTDLLRPIVFIVQGDIIVDGVAETASGYYITDGTFGTVGSGKKLVIDGGVVARSFNLARSLVPADQNLIDPSEKFVYNPSYLWYFRDILGTEHTTFKEVAP